MTAKRMKALAIGISDAGGLAYLRGAVNGAREFHQWAKALGYEAQLLIDEYEPVTLQRLRHELEEMLIPGTPPIHRLAIYFAGHGLIREAEEGLWLLSDWHNELRAVAVEALKRRLYMHGITQISIFADACRALPADIQTADLVPDAVLGRGPIRSETTPAIDKFIAAQDGRRAFMIPGKNPEDDRCLFSGVLLEGLWGAKSSAFSTLIKGRVTSRSLAAYLQAEVPARARRYRCKLVPNVSPTFPEGDDIYFGDGAPPTPPPFPDWPPPEALAGMGHDTEPSDVAVPGPPHASDVLLGAQAPEPASPLGERLRQQHVPHTFETQSGFAVDGGSVRTIWTADEIFAEQYGAAGWWRVGQKHAYELDKPAPVLIEFDDGLFAAVLALPKFIASILRDFRGVSALIYREIYSSPLSAWLSEQAIEQMEIGGLRADARSALATELRQDKHADPVRGVISAYLYDSIGDVESIRRMAYYYIAHYQAIPYDIALLAQMPGQLRDGELRVDVPAVPRREPRTEQERQFTWTHEATPKENGVVGGFWPWMRQGWTFLDEPADDGSTLVLPGLVELIPHVTSARFVTLDATGGRKLAKRFELTPRQ